MQYLPHIIKSVVEKVDAVLSARSEDPFNVFFEYGLYQDVFKTVYTKKGNGDPTYPLVWLVMPFDEDEGRQLDVSAHVSCDIIIAMTTQPEWTMTERENINFFPRIFPIYDELIVQLAASRQLNNSRKDLISRRKRILPYWGGDESGNNNTPNLSKHYVDAIQIKDLRIVVKQNC